MTNGNDILHILHMGNITYVTYYICDILQFIAWSFPGTPNSGSRGVSDSFACFWDPLPHTRLRGPVSF